MLFKKNSRFRFQKITLKSISFGLAKGLAVFIVKGDMDLLFQQSMLAQVMQIDTI